MQNIWQSPQSFQDKLLPCLATQQVHPESSVTPLYIVEGNYRGKLNLCLVGARVSGTSDDF